MNRYLLWKAKYYFLVPGVVFHEIAHLLVVWISPGVTATDVDLTSHVKHEGHYSYIESFAISYAPFVLNTAVSIAFAYGLTTAGEITSIQDAFGSAVLGYGAVVTGLTALPSYEDAISPWNLFRHRVMSRRIFLEIVFSPLIIGLSLPGIIFTRLGRRFYRVRFLISILYAAVIISIGAGIIPIPTEQAFYAQLFQEGISVAEVIVSKANQLA